MHVRIPVHQYLSTFSPRDAIGNEVLIMNSILRGAGYDSEIFCEYVHPEFRHLAKKVNGAKFKAPRGSILIFHFSVATNSLLRLADSESKICLRYHNVTPETFFNQTDEIDTHGVCKVGRSQIAMVSAISDWIMADSQYNADEIKSTRTKNCDVVPLLRNYESIFSNKSDKNFKELLDPHSKKKTILFVGRLAPNKRQEDLIQYLSIYKKCVDSDLRLIMIGSELTKSYREKLCQYCLDLGLKVSNYKDKPDPDFDVLLTGSVSDEVLLAAYQNATAFVSVSEHEGFCVPIVEAMRAGLPILAHPSSAIPATIGEAGVLSSKFQPESFIADLKRVLTDSAFRDHLKRNCKIRYQDLKLESASSLFMRSLNQMVLFYERRSIE